MIIIFGRPCAKECKTKKSKTTKKRKTTKMKNYKNSKNYKRDDKAIEERKAMRKAVADAVAKLTPEQRLQILEHYKGVMTIEERRLSEWNTWALCLQRVCQKNGNFEMNGDKLPDLSIVGGFKQWKSHGRRVKKGEKAIYIAVPCFHGKQAKPEDGAMILPDQLKSIEENEMNPYFKMVPMFDVSQTEPIDAALFAQPQLMGETIEVEAVAM